MEFSAKASSKLGFIEFGDALVVEVDIFEEANFDFVEDCKVVESFGEQFSGF